MKYNVIHVAPNGKETIIRKNVSIREANEAFYGIDNTYIEYAHERNKHHDSIIYKPSRNRI